MNTRWQRFKLQAGVWLVECLLRLVFLSCRKTYPKQKLPEQGSVVVFWHGRLAFMCFVYKHLWDNKRKRGKVIVSDHKDGEIITRVIRRFGIETLRGSSSKGGAKVLIHALKEIKNGTDIIITPDGPRGPRHSVADGAAVIAQKQDCAVYVLNYEADRFWELRSWDKMMIPKPFSKITFGLSPAFSVAGMDLEQAGQEIQAQMWRQSVRDGGKTVAEHQADFHENLQWWRRKHGCADE